MATTYSTRDEAITREIIEVINNGDASADEFNVDAIADAVLGDFAEGFAVIVDEATFWNTVADNAK